MNKEEIKQLKDEFKIHFKNNPVEFRFLVGFIDDLRAKDEEELLKEIEGARNIEINTPEYEAVERFRKTLINQI